MPPRALAAGKVGDTVPAPQGYHDFVLLPRRKGGTFVVLPTPVKLLGQGGDVLAYREVRRTDDTLGISPAQDQLFRHIVRSSEVENSTCKWTVMAVHGLPGEDRQMCLYDHMTGAVSPPWVDATDHDIQSHIRGWFLERVSRR